MKDRRSLFSMSTGHNENNKLKRLWIGALTSEKSPKNKVRYTQPQILFLIETKLDHLRKEKDCNKCGFKYGIHVDAQGTRDGLSMRWKDGIEIQLLSFFCESYRCCYIRKPWDANLEINRVLRSPRRKQ